jgi:DNA polymerase III epsilon subunit-like protein
MRLVFLDTETTSVRPDRRVWEIGAVVRDEGQADDERAWLIDSAGLDLGNADSRSLQVGRFYDRHPEFNGTAETVWCDEEAEALIEVEHLTRGARIVGAVPSFDAEVLSTRMRANGICPSWDYHLIDVESLAAGALRLAPPWKLDDLLTAYGLVYDEAERHTALGDARMVRDLYDAVMAGKGQ